MLLFLVFYYVSTSSPVKRFAPSRHARSSEVVLLSTGCCWCWYVTIDCVTSIGRMISNNSCRVLAQYESILITMQYSVAVLHVACMRTCRREWWENKILFWKYIFKIFFENTSVPSQSILDFLPRDAARKRGNVVGRCPSLCLSHLCIVSKHLKISSNTFRCYSNNKNLVFLEQWYFSSKNHFSFSFYIFTQSF